MQRLVSGIQPSGQLHIGNYLGALKQWVELQDDYEAFFFVADYHALTTRPSSVDLRESVLHVLAMMIAVGVDPKSSVIFAQSQIPAQAELACILNSFTTVGELQRMTQFKEKSDRFGQNAGLFTYPVLMAADVLIYQAEVVPVGDDQVQHLELAREIARTVNRHLDQPIFTEPKPLLNTASRITSLSDPSKKMSKSLPGSAIGLLDDEATVAQTIRRAVTDSDPNAAKISPAIANLLTILEGISGPEIRQKAERQRQAGKLRYSELKEQLLEDLLEFLRPIQQTYRSLIQDPSELERILRSGRAKAEPIANETLIKVKKALGLIS